jgi:hypothetical protein
VKGSFVENAYKEGSEKSVEFKFAPLRFFFNFTMETQMKDLPF